MQENNEWGMPAASHSEYVPGETVKYQTGGFLREGAVLYAGGWPGGPQLYVIENRDSGFVDVVSAGEIVAVL